MIEIILIAYALSLDASAAAITCGIKLKVIQWQKFLKISITFAILQSLMPTIGILFSKYLLITMVPDSIPKWIAFAIFLVLGLKTLKEAITAKEANEICCFCIDKKCLITLGIATSVDALLIGIVYPFKFDVSPFIAIPIFGGITFLNSLIGLLLGNRSYFFLKKFSYFFAAGLLLLLAFKQLI